MLQGLPSDLPQPPGAPYMGSRLLRQLLLLSLALISTGQGPACCSYDKGLGDTISHKCNQPPSLNHLPALAGVHVADATANGTATQKESQAQRGGVKVFIKRCIAPWPHALPCCRAAAVPQNSGRI